MWRPPCKRRSSTGSPAASCTLRSRRTSAICHSARTFERWSGVPETAIYCMTMSAAYHLFSNLSEKTMKKFQSLDFAGISLLTFGSAMPFLYYAFCSPFWRTFHMIFFSSFSLLTFSFAFVNYNRRTRRG